MDVHDTVALIILAAALLLGVGGSFAVADDERNVPASAALCVLEMRGYPGFSEGEGFADHLFEQGKYIEAAQAYYKVYRCGYMTTINPQVADADELGPFDKALQDAAAGKFSIAAVELRKILSVLPRFADARLLLGEFQWATGMHAQARAAWRSAVTTPDFVAPPDSGPNDYAAIRAKRFLHWASSPEYTDG